MEPLYLCTTIDFADNLRRNCVEYRGICIWEDLLKWLPSDHKLIASYSHGDGRLWLVEFADERTFDEVLGHRNLHIWAIPPGVDLKS